ncbi:MAG: CPBP family intramembrane glutamic endopeptidase [Pseudomonadota bacterium]
MSYAGFERFTAPAKLKSELWRSLTGLLLILVLYAVGAVVAIQGAVTIFAGQIGPGDVAEGRTPLGVAILLFHFAFMAGAVFVVTKYLHRRSIWTLFGDWRQMQRDFTQMALVAIAVAVVANVAAHALFDVTDRMPVTDWLIWLPVALPLVLLQTGAEELLFRGYLLQQFGARFGVGARVAWMILPAVIFAVLHVDPASQGGNIYGVLLVITIFALITADVTARSGTLGAAWALHFVNNVQVILLMSLDGPLTGLSLSSIGIAADDPAALWLFAADAVALIVIYALWRRRYG